MPGAQFRVVTPPGQQSVSERVTALCGGEVERLPHLGLRDLLALLSWTSLYIGNDGGALHSAVALGVPTVGLFGPTDPDAWFPYTDWGPYRVVRRDRAAEDDRPGRHDSRQRDITVEEVFRAAREVRALARSHRVEPLDWSPDRSR